MDGIVNVMKPAGMTSHDVVARLRRIYHTKKVGHTGTLDPDAVGVLPVCVGQATRLVEYLTEKDKVYRVLMHFGQETETQDASGTVTRETDISPLTRPEFEQVLQSFIGEQEQIPPMYSAIKRDGQPLYKLARQGVQVALEPRRITIWDIKLLMYNQQSAMLEVHCGKGTYIRTLCQDIGRACGSSAHLAYLLRIRSGQFDLAESKTLDQLEAMADPGEALLGLAEALPEVAAWAVEDARVLHRLANGLAQRGPFAAEDEGRLYKVVHPDGYLLAIGHVQEGYFKPDKVFKAVE